MSISVIKPDQAEREWLFADLYGEELFELRPFLRPISYEKGSIIFEEGEPAFGVYLIERGKVKLAKRLASGHCQILKLAGPGEILGEGILFQAESYNAYAKTLEETKVHFIRTDDLLGFLKRHPAVAIKIIEKLALEIKGFQNKVLEASYEGGLEKVARILLAIAERWGKREDGGLYIGVELSRAELAEMAGLASETASRILSRLREREVLSLVKHKIIIKDEERLRKLMEPLCVSLKESLL